MIKVSGSARRAFAFPAELPVAYAYYADVGRVLSYLPRICLVRAYGPDRFRLVYRSTELGVYHVRIFADVETRLEEGWVLRVAPLNSSSPLKGRADAHTTSTQGYFSSRSVFYDEGEQTRIEYNLKLWGDLPTPRGLRFMPGFMVDRVAATITGMRMAEIVAGFIERSVDAFPDWLAEMQNHHAWPDLSQARALAVPVPDCPEEHPELPLVSGRHRFSQMWLKQSRVDLWKALVGSKRRAGTGRGDLAPTGGSFVAGGAPGPAPRG